MAVSSFISLSRENILRYINDAEDFVEKNPALQDLKQQFTGCAELYKESRAKSSCGCGGNIKSVTPCITALIDRLESFREANPEAIQQFVEYVSKRPTQEGRQTNVTIYYAKEGEKILSRYSYIA